MCIYKRVILQQKLTTINTAAAEILADQPFNENWKRKSIQVRPTYTEPVTLTSYLALQCEIPNHPFAYKRKCFISSERSQLQDYRQWMVILSLLNINTSKSTSFGIFHQKLKNLYQRWLYLLCYGLNPNFCSNRLSQTHMRCRNHSQ